MILIRDVQKWGREEVSGAPNSVPVLWREFNQHCSTKEKNKDLISVICFKMLNDYLCAQSVQPWSGLAGRQIRNTHAYKEAWLQLISAAIDMFGRCRYQPLIFFPSAVQSVSERETRLSQSHSSCAGFSRPLFRFLSRNLDFPLFALIWVQPRWGLALHAFSISTWSSKYPQDFLNLPAFSLDVFKFTEESF